ncbi:e3 ubiquitin-protein ligase [Nannochloropsis gaditana]|uniref:E3 ubiquitin-protein ligase n=1 Tax=Nannochloropsis gaditana TaxID=72520 RepID=W7TVD9_9STRA|nr:e3 ubiquitin-protein ligase [Nannochloropsis gaditana]
MFLYVSSVSALYRLNGRMPATTRLMRFLSHARNGLDAFGLIWFVVGNMWLFGGDVEICPHPNRSPVYSLCVAFVFINYAQLCLPCVVVIIMLPVLCFCLPCLIRILARIQDPMRGKGATPSMINKLPMMKYRQIQAEKAATASAGSLEGQAAPPASQGGEQDTQVSVTGVESNSTSCAVCISEYAPDEDVRLLPCAHYFHASVGKGGGREGGRAGRREGGKGRGLIGCLDLLIRGIPHFFSHLGSASCPASSFAFPPSLLPLPLAAVSLGPSPASLPTLSIHTLPSLPLSSQCVDEWLKVNASCPTCRASILPESAEQPTPRSSHYGTTSAGVLGSSASTSLSGGSTGNSPGGAGQGTIHPLTTSPLSSASSAIPTHPGTPHRGGSLAGGRASQQQHQVQQQQQQSSRRSTGDHLV